MLSCRRKGTGIFCADWILETFICNISPQTTILRRHDICIFCRIS